MVLNCKVISHMLTVKYKCPNLNETLTVTLTNPLIDSGYRFEDDQYIYANVDCKCGTFHLVEI